MNFKKSLYSCNTKRCVAKEALLRTFCPFPAQGLGRWCAGVVRVRVGVCDDDGDFAYLRKDGVMVCPIGCLKP